MVTNMSILFLASVAVLGVSWALPLGEIYHIPGDLDQKEEAYELVPIADRHVRSLQLETPNFPAETGQQPWEVNPSIIREARKTGASIGITHHGHHHHIHAGINVGGGKPSYHVDGSFKW